MSIGLHLSVSLILIDFSVELRNLRKTNTVSDTVCVFCLHSYLEFLQSLEEKVDNDWERISSSLEDIRKSLLSREGCLINMTAEGKNLTNSEKFVGKFLDLLPNNSPLATTSWNARLPSANEAIVIPTQVRMKILYLQDSFFHICWSNY